MPEITNLTDMTMNDTYQNLIRELCAAVKLPDADAIVNSAAFQVDGICVSLRYDKGAPGIMLVYTEFGPVPEKDNGAIYHQLLQENFTVAIGSTGSFSMAPKNKNIVYILALDLHNTTVGDLVFHLGRMSHLAGEWRTTHCIGDGVPLAAQQRGQHSLMFNTKRST
jgi:hypothetical protein